MFLVIEDKSKEDKFLSLFKCAINKSKLLYILPY